MAGAVEAGTNPREFEDARRWLAAIVRSSEDAIIGKTLTGTIVSWNASAEHLYGYTSEEAVGNNIAMIVPPEREEELREIFASLRRGGAITHHETIRVRKDGRRIHVSVSISPIRDEAGAITGAATIARDITESKRIDEERAQLLIREQAARAYAEETQRRLAYLAEASSILSESLDYETTLVNVARLSVPQVGDWCIVDVIGEDGTMRRLATAHADPAKEAIAQEYSQRYPAGSEGSDSEVILQSDKPLLYSEVTDEQLVAAARDEEHLKIMRQLGLSSVMMVPLEAHDRVVGSITFVSAESGHRYGAEDLALAQDLARRAATAVDNARLYRQAQDALRLRDEFLSIASHELKTPLTSLQLQVQVLQRFVRQVSMASAVPERATAILDAVERQIKRLSKLVGDLLDVSSITAGYLDMEREEMDLVDLVQEVIARFELEVSAAATNVELRAKAPVVGYWDRMRIDQVVTNMLSNAIKYGQGRLIEIEVDEAGPVARLSVRDHGIGIAPDLVSKIFDRFERLDTSQNYGGLGLGLHIVRQIVEAHCGTIEVESQPDLGSTFTLELPLRQPPCEARTAEGETS